MGRLARLEGLLKRRNQVHTKDERGRREEESERREETESSSQRKIERKAKRKKTTEGEGERKDKKKRKADKRERERHLGEERSLYSSDDFYFISFYCVDHPHSVSSVYTSDFSPVF